MICGCFGGCGGLGMCCGPEIIGLLCILGVVCVCVCMVLQAVTVCLC